MPAVCSAAVATGSAAAVAFDLMCATGFGGGAVEPESRLQAEAASDTQSSRTFAPVIVFSPVSIFSPAMLPSLPNMPLITTGAAPCASQFQRRLEHRCQLVLQRAVVLLPIARFREPGKSHGKGRIMPASRQPC